jgi:hypothetical protein
MSNTDEITLSVDPLNTKANIGVWSGATFSPDPLAKNDSSTIWTDDNIWQTGNDLTCDAMYNDVKPIVPNIDGIQWSGKTCCTVRSYKPYHGIVKTSTIPKPSIFWRIATWLALPFCTVLEIKWNGKTCCTTRDKPYYGKVFTPNQILNDPWTGKTSCVEYDYDLHNDIITLEKQIQRDKICRILGGMTHMTYSNISLSDC